MMPAAGPMNTKFVRVVLRRHRGKLFLAAILASAATNISYADQVSCGGIDNANDPKAYGPFDYTNPEHFSEKLPIVERAHFTTEVESLVGHVKCGGNGCNVHNDIDYTLRAFPNHHRALLAMSNYHLQGFHKSRRPMRYSAECYFDKALQFNASDATVHAIYGYYLSKLGKPQEATERYEHALELAPDSAEIHYNLGLLYADQEDYLRARTHAERAYKLGFPLPGLRDKLKKAGEWQPNQSQ